MKKHVIGRVPAHKEPVGKRISRLHIPARIFCFFTEFALLQGFVKVSFFHSATSLAQAHAGVNHSVQDVHNQVAQKRQNRHKR